MEQPRTISTIRSTSTTTLRFTESGITQAGAPTSSIHFTKTIYDEKEMLGQFGDFSGHWTSEKLAIIHRQGLLEK